MPLAYFLQKISLICQINIRILQCHIIHSAICIRFLSAQNFHLYTTLHILFGRYRISPLQFTRLGGIIYHAIPLIDIDEKLIDSDIAIFSEIGGFPLDSLSDPEILATNRILGNYHEYYTVKQQATSAKHRENNHNELRSV